MFFLSDADNRLGGHSGGVLIAKTAGAVEAFRLGTTKTFTFIV